MALLLLCKQVINTRKLGKRLEWILSTFPVTSCDQANFGKSPIFSYILGLGGWNRVGGIKYALFDSLNPNLDKKKVFLSKFDRSCGVTEKVDNIHSNLTRKLAVKLLYFLF